MRRRDLEQRVIAEARRVANSTASYLDEAIEDLVDALEKLDKLREVERPRASAIAPPTSHEAAAWVRGKRMSVAKRIVEHLKVRYLSQRVGSTVDMFMAFTGISHQTASARFNELLNAGWIVDSGQTRSTRQGRDAVVWMLTPAALKVLQQSREPVFSDG